MNLDLYEVTRDEYKGFVAQIQPSCVTMVTEELGRSKIARWGYSNKTQRKLFGQIYNDEDYEYKYYVFEMPDNNERKAPPVVRHVVLNDPQDVEDFFKALSNCVNAEEKK